MDHSSQLRAFDEINPFFRNWIEFTFDKVKLFGHHKIETDNFQKQNKSILDFIYFRNTFNTNMCPGAQVQCHCHVKFIFSIETRSWQL